ncbi:MAG: hypothetical protein U1F83_09245 [Verrucomicrobiota bacterium]
MPLLPNTLLVLFLGTVHAALGADSLAITTLDPDFAPGLSALKQVTGFSEQPADQCQTDWQPNLQLLVGVKAVEKSQRTIYFVELTTLTPPPTNSLGQPWQPALRTNDWAWSPSNRSQFITTLYPVRARVFDETGRLVKEGQTPMAWGMLTNGLMDLCRISLEAYPSQTNSRVTGPDERPREGNETATPRPQDNEKLMRATGGGFLWMIGMFSDLQTVPAVANVWDQAQCAIRWPSMWTIATSIVRGFSVSIEPQIKKVALVNAAADVRGPLYCLPVNLNCDKRNLSHVEIVVGPARGAEMLLAGIRSIRAVHPTRAQHEFLAQVLAVGTSREEQ